MYIIDETIKNLFIEGLATNHNYAPTLRMLSIRNRADIEYAVVKLYSSGIVFRIARQRRICGEAAIQSALTAYVDKIWAYFNITPNTHNDQANFDKFHEELCDCFLSISSSAGFSHTYGNAQKMTNMIFKYLTCFSDYMDFADLFSYCHVPIDSIILGKFELIYHVPNTTNGRVYRGQYSGKYNGVSWTAMSKNDYMALLSDYRAALSATKGNHSWLGLEYYIWSGMPLPTTGTHAPVIKEFHM